MYEKIRKWWHMYWIKYHNKSRNYHFKKRDEHWEKFRIND